VELFITTLQALHDSWSSPLKTLQYTVVIHPMNRNCKKPFQVLRLNIGRLAYGIGLLVYTCIVFMVGLKTEINKTSSHETFQVSKGVEPYLTAFCSQNLTNVTSLFRLPNAVFKEEECLWVIDETESFAKKKHDWYLLHDPSFNTNTYTTSKYQQYFHDMDLRIVLSVHSFVGNKIQSVILPVIAQVLLASKLLLIVYVA
jgi:hypothetical protein